MKAAYINLDAAVARRAQVEAGFARVVHDGWTLQRFQAVTATQMAQAPGRLLPTEKACFESHRRLIGQHLDDDAPLFVLEDDVAFSGAAFPVLSAMLKSADDWDLLFTDVAIVQPGQIIDLIRTRERLARDSEVTTAPLNGAHFASATAYLVRGSAKARLHGLLTAAGPLDLPYDLWLQQACAAGQLKASVCLPFLTTLSEHSAESQIRQVGWTGHQALDLFRRLMFIERDLNACESATAALEAGLSRVERALGAVIGGLNLL